MIVSFVCIGICSVILFLAAIMNMKEYSPEFGVLRAIGLTKASLIRLSIYEALILNISSIAIGSISGFIASVLFSLQYALLSDMYLVLKYEILVICLSCLLSVFASIVGTWIAIRDPINRNISTMIKGQ